MMTKTAKLDLLISLSILTQFTMAINIKSQKYHSRLSLNLQRIISIFVILANDYWA